jgi:hypothetical protein
MPEKWSFEMKDIQDIIQDHPDLQLFYVNLTVSFCLIFSIGVLITKLIALFIM